MTTSSYYEERYVAFVDILGFSEIARDPAIGGQIWNALEVVDMSKVVTDDGIKVSTFSDCVALSTPPEPVGLKSLFDRIHNLTVIMLFQPKLLVRGGIAKGLLHHSDRGIFGPAFLEAYRLESTVAKFPRVIVDEGVYRDFHAHKATFPFDVGLRHDRDGPSFVDSFGPFSPNVPDRKDNWRTPHVNRLKRHIEELVDKAMFSPRHFEKLIWIVNYFNERVAEDGYRILLPAERTSPEL